MPYLATLHFFRDTSFVTSQLPDPGFRLECPDANSSLFDSLLRLPQFCGSRRTRTKQAAKNYCHYH